MQPIEIAKDIYCLGAIDWNVRDFHGYSTDRGSTYNAYLIMDEKVALMKSGRRLYPMPSNTLPISCSPMLR